MRANRKCLQTKSDHQRYCKSLRRGLGTVSRAINGKPGVKQEVRKKILNYVHEMGWRSNNIAGKLNSARKGSW